jgi:hypothetical protein
MTIQLTDEVKRELSSVVPSVKFNAITITIEEWGVHVAFTNHGNLIATMDQRNMTIRTGDSITIAGIVAEIPVTTEFY